jgi:hypothetical protein
MVTRRGKYNGAQAECRRCGFGVAIRRVVEERSSCSEAEPEGQVERGEVRMLE